MFAAPERIEALRPPVLSNKSYPVNETEGDCVPLGVDFCDRDTDCEGDCVWEIVDV